MRGWLNLNYILLRSASIKPSLPNASAFLPNSSANLLLFFFNYLIKSRDSVYKKYLGISVLECIKSGVTIVAIKIFGGTFKLYFYIHNFRFLVL